jgi:hypothetical protein
LIGIGSGDSVDPVAGKLGDVFVRWICCCTVLDAFSG